MQNFKLFRINPNKIPRKITFYTFYTINYPASGGKPASNTKANALSQP